MKNQSPTQTDLPPKIFIEDDKVPPLNIPESRGDSADEAQDQIDWDIREEINRVRRNLHSRREN